MEAYHEDNLYLHISDNEVEVPALFILEIETYTDEDGSTVSDVTRCTLKEWGFFKRSRADAIFIDDAHEAEIVRQEQRLAKNFDPTVILETARWNL